MHTAAAGRSILESIYFARPAWARTAMAPVALPAGANPPAIALLSVFDGVGLARLALGDVLLMLNMQQYLEASGFAEIDDALANAVSIHWRHRAGLQRRPPHVRVAPGVWDLLRGARPSLQDFLTYLPPH